MDGSYIKTITFNPNKPIVARNVDLIKQKYPHINVVQSNFRGNYNITTCDRKQFVGRDAENLITALLAPEPEPRIPIEFAVQETTASYTPIEQSNGNLINILIRTSNRPKGFARMMNMIERQTYKNYRIIVSVDDDASELYVSKYKNLEYIRLNRIPRTEPEHCPYNLYFNELINQVTDGWIFFVDDDDALNGTQTLAKINANLKDPEKLYIFRMKRPTGIIPGKNFGKDVVECDIATPNILVHSSKARLSKWPDRARGDFKYISGLVSEMGKSSLEWVDEITYVVNTIGQGKRSDIRG